MRKILPFVLLACAMTHQSSAQLSQGGIPLAKQLKMDEPTTAIHNYQRPAFEEAVKAREQQEAKTGVPRSYLVALGTSVDISFPESGTIVKTADNRIVWRAVVNVDDAGGIGFSYDKFHLPEGVRYYISNGNNNQILGAYTYSNNRPSGLFANEPVQGHTANIEMDIDASVNLNDIQLHINKAVAYFRGIEYLQDYKNTAARPTDEDNFDSTSLNVSSVCMIDARCPTAANYFNQRRATLSVIMADTSGNYYGLCSGVMVNNAYNSTAHCTNYLITASHCDDANSTGKNDFEQMLLRYNFEKNTCNGTDKPISNTLIGSYFVSRANFDITTNQIKGDFLLLNPIETIPASWNVVLAGWNRDSAIAPKAILPKKFKNFSQPLGDVKKFASSDSIYSSSFNGVDLTHWSTTFKEGYSAAGGGGSGLFDGDGYLIGTLTGGASIQPIDSCNTTNAGIPVTAYLVKSEQFSKVSYTWNNNDTASRILKPWLDPQNTGVLKIEGTKATTCSTMDTMDTPPNPVTGIQKVSIDAGINIYPNPTSGSVNVQFNLTNIADININLIDFSGRSLKSYNISKVKSGVYKLNVEGVADGMYMLRISDGNAVSNKKLMIRK
jgi:hypothetical protein